MKISKQTKYVIGLPAIFILLMIGCSKTSEDQLAMPPPLGCDTVNMSYSADVRPILETNCYSCHGNGNANGGITLDTYQAVNNVATSGMLMGVITHTAGYSPMPKGGAKLSVCDINKIKDWIDRGASNN